MPSVLVDTNVLVYAHDRGEFAKQERAIRVLEHLLTLRKGCLSAQSLAEFFSITRKGPRPMLTAAEASRQVERLARAWPVLDVTGLAVLEAVRGVRAHQLPYWDAQLWAVARLNQIPVIFSEDSSAGAVLEGVRFVNPLAERFDLAAWV